MLTAKVYDEGHHDVYRFQMTVMDRSPAQTFHCPNIGFRRTSDRSLMGPRVRYWLQAVTRHIVHYVCFTPSTGLSDFR